MAEFGHVKISRRAYATDRFWLEPREFSKWEAWEWMIQAAAWRDHKRAVGMTVVELRRGEFLASLRYLAEAWGWSLKKTRNFIALVSEMDQIRAQRETHAGTVYMLVNYDTYQSTPEVEGTEKGTRGAQQGHSRGTAGAQRRSSKAVKAGKAEEGTRAVRAHQLPGDWSPNEQHAEIAAERGVDMEAEAVKMRDWAAAEGKVKKDWDATFRNWLRRADPVAAGRGGHLGSSSPRVLDAEVSTIPEETLRAMGVL